MALSGSFYKYPVDNFGLYCTWSATQSVTGNYSDVTLNVYLKYYTLNVGSRSDSTVSINGVSETYTAPAISDSSADYDLTLLKTYTVRVNHNSNGTKTGVALSAYWRFSGTYSGTSITSITASTTIDLDAIDRTAPTVTCSISNITANSFKIAATSSATADQWFYSLDDGGSSTLFSSTAGTSASTTVTGLSPNTTYYVRAMVRKKGNQVYGETSSVTVKTLGGAIINSCPTITADATTVTFKPNVTVYDASYSYYLSVYNGSTEYLALSARTWSKGTVDRTITLSQTERADLLDAMANIKSFTATIKVVTKSGTTQIGSTSSCSCTVQTTSANSAPTMTAFTFKDSRSTTAALTGNDQLFIQGYSYLYVTPGVATAKNGASIVKYAATCNGVTNSNTTGAAINLYEVSKSGTVDVVVTATDSRGYTVSSTQQITVIPYAKPKVSNISLRRTNDIEAEMQLTFNGSISPITVGGAQKNSLLYVQYRYKLTSASSYGSYTSILSSVTQSGTIFSFSNLELCSLDANSSYDFHIYIRDQLNTLSALSLYFTVPQGTPLVALRKKMVGINTPTPDSALHVVGDGHFEGDVRIEGTLTPDNLDYDFGVPPFYYGTCATAAATVAKVVTCSGFVLETGATIAVKFTYYNTGASPTLNVNSTGDIAIKQYGSTAASTYMWRSGEVVLFVYNGSYWELISKSTATTTYYGLTKLSSSVTSTSTTLAATASAVKQAYDRQDFEEITLETALAVAYGGTGATTAAAARTNLGITCTSLYSGTLTTGSTTFNYGSYKAYVIIGQPNSTSARVSLFIPKGQLTTTATTYQLADETNYYTFNISYSGSTVTLAYKGRSGSGQVLRVFGVN
ncbi:MAG: tail fiber protein [Oscillospiraceae bacterium]|nr:tail fiber protein [Oscillospiraceae bacterium]